MKIDDDLTLFAILSSAFVLEGSEDETAKNKLKDIFTKAGIDVDTFERSDVNTEKEFVNWLEKTIDKFQVAIEEYEGLER